MPTHRHDGYPRWRKAYYQPAGLSSGWVGFAPTGQ